MKVFGVDYQFLACGDVFTQGLVHAAEEIGIEYAHTDWSDPHLPLKLRGFNPDLLFVVHGRRFAARFPNAYRPITSAVWLLDEPYEVDDTSGFSRIFDHVFVNDQVTLDRHLHASYLPTCYDPVVHRFTDGARPRRVGFVGGGNSTRDRYLSALAGAGLLSYVVGGSWADPDVARRCLADNCAPAITAQLYRETQIVVNIFRERHHFNARQTPATTLNPRVYEALACGALVVSEWRPEIDTLIPELPTFRSPEECVALIRELLADPDRAEAIRRACAERIAGETYAARLRSVLSVAGLQVAA